MMLLLLAWGRVTQAEITLDGTLGPSGPLAGPHYPIPAEVGRQVGSNLFHSFGKFSVNTGESATFSGPESIDNVIGRVTGGDASWIDGTLRNQIPSADLYLLNPAGVLFGPNAYLDVDGSFHASTADYVRLDDGGRFDARDPSQSILTAASPAAFGFLEENPNGISLERSALTVDAGKSLSLVGGDIDIVGDPKKTSLSAPGGRINIASVASPGEVIPSAVHEGADVQMNAFAQQGEIRLSEAAELNAGGDGGGTIVIRGGRFVADNSAVQASAKGPMDESQAANPGEGIDIEVTGSVELTNGSQLNTNVFSGVTQDSGGVRITADSLKVEGFNDVANSSINSVVFTNAIGNSGDIEIEAKNVIVENRGFVRVNTAGSGDSGNIIIRTESLELHDGGSIFTLVFSGGAGDAGDIEVEAENVLLSTTAPDVFTIISSQTGKDSTGAAGDVRVTTHSLQLLPWTAISSVTLGTGRGGSVEVVADNVQIAGAKDGTGEGTGLFTNTFGSGRGGGLRVAADTMVLTDRASLQTQAQGIGDGGNITLSTTDLQVEEGSFITTSSVRGAGVATAGDIEISTKNLSIYGFPSASDPFGFDASGILSEGKEGHAGNIRISATEGAHLTNSASISASSYGAGQGGKIEIASQRLELLNGSNILSSAFGLGNGGTIKIDVGEAIISGMHPEPFVSITGDESLAFSGVASQANRKGGSAGNIYIVTETLEVEDRGKISTETFGSGKGGDIELLSKDITFSGHASVSSESTDVGNAGNIKIKADNSFVSHDSAVTAQAIEAGGGNIEIQGQKLVLFSTSSVTTSVASGASDAGNITIDPIFVIVDKSAITANAFEGKGGNIRIAADYLFLSSDSRIDASSNRGIDGIVIVDAPDTDISGSLVALPAVFFDPTTVMTKPCAERSGADVIHFVIRKYEVLPASPYALQTHLPKGALEGEVTRPAASAHARPEATTGWRLERVYGCGGDA